MDTALDLLARSKYVLLTTFRRDGTPVPTPVWVVRVGQELLVWTNPAAGKVKRIRRDGRVQIGPCSRSGKPLGRSVAAHARILDEDESSVVLPALIRKYGLVARLTTSATTLHALFGRPPRPVGGVAITLTTGIPAQVASVDS
jgi:PPOX class probable F420-dependent enzyme